MEEEYANITSIELASNIFVPYEWPVGRIYDVVLSLATDIIMQNIHDDPILRVNGIAARLYRIFNKGHFYHVFKKISDKDLCGSHVYDIGLSEQQNTFEMECSSGMDVCDESKPRNIRSSSKQYTISNYYVPHGSSRQELLNLDATAHAMRRRAMRNVKRMS